MPDVVGFREKVVQVCELNRALDRNAPANRSALSVWLGLAAGTLSSRYKGPVATLTISLERAIVMALGFGPEDSDFAEHGERAWSRWTATWGNQWRTGDPKDFVKKLEDEGFFVARPPEDARLVDLLPKIRRRNFNASPAEDVVPVKPAAPLKGVSRTEGRYLDRLASLQVTCIRERQELYHLLATCTFGTVEVPTDDTTYLVSINRCSAEILLREASFEPQLEREIINSRSKPIRKMKIERESSRLNHPSWRMSDVQPKTPLNGEYCELKLGSVSGAIGDDDEASLLVHKAGFAVSAVSGVKLEEGGILTSLLRYLVTEHVGEIEQRGSYLYHLSIGPIVRGHDD